MIRNRSYQIRSRRYGLVSAGDVIQELVERARDRERFYRPERRTKPGIAAKECKKSSGKLQGVQLELFADELKVNCSPSVNSDPDRPLFDLFPEAYDNL